MADYDTNRFEPAASATGESNDEVSYVTNSEQYRLATALVMLNDSWRYISLTLQLHVLYCIWWED
jgi:hypothetical protein